MTNHIDLTKGEVNRINEVTTFIAQHSNDWSIRTIKRQFDLTDEEYETMMDLTMPIIRERNYKQAWKSLYLKLLREMARAVTPPSEMPPDQRRVMDWSEDPVLRLERVTRMVRAAYDEMHQSGKSAEDIMTQKLSGMPVFEDEEE